MWIYNICVFCIFGRFLINGVLYLSLFVYFLLFPVVILQYIKLTCFTRCKHIACTIEELLDWICQSINKNIHIHLIKKYIKTKKIGILDFPWVQVFKKREIIKFEESKIQVILLFINQVQGSDRPLIIVALIWEVM